MNAPNQSDQENNKKIHPKLIQKLKETEEKYVKVTEFSELLPMFSEEIIKEEWTKENYCKLSSHFEKMYFDWGICWSPHTPTNYPKEKHSEVGFVTIYINCYSLFNSECYKFAHSKLIETLENIKVHFYDHLNSTFYFLPDECEDGLKKINNWYVSVKEKVSEYLKQKKIKDLENQLEELTKGE